MCLGCGLVRFWCKCVSVIFSENWYHRHKWGRRSPPWKHKPKQPQIPILGQAFNSELQQRIRLRGRFQCCRGDAVLGYCKDLPVPLQSPHSCLRKKAQLPDRVTTDVQALSHPVAVIFSFTWVCAGSSRWEPDLPSSSGLFLFFSPYCCCCNS